MSRATRSLFAGFVLSLALVGAVSATGSKSKPAKGSPAKAAGCEPKKLSAAEKKLSDATAAQKKAKTAASKKKADEAVKAAQGALAALGCKDKGGSAKNQKELDAANKKVADDKKARADKEKTKSNAVMTKVNTEFNTRMSRLAETLRSIDKLREAVKSCSVKWVDEGGTTGDMKLYGIAQNKCTPFTVQRAHPKWGVARVRAEMNACMDSAEKAALKMYNEAGARAKSTLGSAKCEAVTRLNGTIAKTNTAIEKAGDAEKKAAQAVVKLVRDQAGAISARFKKEAKPTVKAWLLQKAIPMLQNKAESQIEDQVTGVIGFAVTQVSQAAFGVSSKLTAGAEICAFIRVPMDSACGLIGPEVVAACEVGCEGFAYEAVAEVQKKFEETLTSEIYDSVFKQYVHGKGNEVAQRLVASIDSW